MRRKHTHNTKKKWDAAVQRVVDLAQDMPCIVDAPGIDPFDPSVLEEWIGAKGRTAMQVHCGRLVLTAFHPFHNWSCGRFDLSVACWVWDEAHRDAFTHWARDPVFVWDSMVPADFWDEPLSVEEFAVKTGKSQKHLEAEFAEIRKKLGARNQLELTRIMKVTALLSHGGDGSEGHA